MTTYVSLASSATMFPSAGTIVCTPLTPEMVKARLAYTDLVVSTLTDDHAAIVNAIEHLYGINVPLPIRPALPVKLRPGDELFVIQSELSRLAIDGLRSLTATDAASISFQRWRVPVSVEVKAPQGPRGLPQRVFDEIIDHAHSIALWQRGASQLKGFGELVADFKAEQGEFDEAWKAWIDADSGEGSNECLDVYLEFADLAYKALCLHYAGGGYVWYKVVREADENIDLWRGIDVMLAKYGRRASGLGKDKDAERALVAPLFQR